MEIKFTGKSIRDQLHKTVRQVAADTTLAPSTISKWENGKSTPSLEQLVILAEYYSVPWNELVEVIK